jgi:hypothetical protein
MNSVLYPGGIESPTVRSPHADRHVISIGWGASPSETSLEGSAFYPGWNTTLQVYPGEGYWMPGCPLTIFTLIKTMINHQITHPC